MSIAQTREKAVEQDLPVLVAPVVVPDPSFLESMWRASRIVWQRELIRFWRSKLRVVTSLAQPVLYLFVFGTGLGRLVSEATTAFDYRTFLFPGIVSMSILFTAVFSAVSIVWDREFGFLREMLVAPVPRSGLVVGKALGGGTVATIQGALVLVLAPLVGVSVTPLIVVQTLFAMAVLAICLTSFGIVIAARMQRIESFQAVMQFFLMPLFFLSGALFPITNLPGWLALLVRLNPMTYGVTAIRRIVFQGVDLAPEAARAAGLDLTWGGYVLPTWLLLAVVAGFGLMMLGVSVLSFRSVE